eukprot:CAMPEP_0184545096 /NCGR_PEP_ID=MMETSP0199_2-20130426/4068_1 /TAXON_ID=1112570 /ORGANISM="Thraustochytrium sp., Strain LLF1b" /LENGTH=720 /DNA_ID=CAMNT_0026939355 /DNA_START=82 /DNA_END=2241 /DNA_ORIENTATION=-
MDGQSPRNRNPEVSWSAASDNAALETSSSVQREDAESTASSVSAGGLTDLLAGETVAIAAPPRQLAANAERKPAKTHMRGRTNTDFSRRYARDAEQELKRRKSFDASPYIKDRRGSAFDMELLTRTSFAIEREHQVHIPDEEDLDGMGDLEIASGNNVSPVSLPKKVDSVAFADIEDEDEAAEELLRMSSKVSRQCSANSVSSTTQPWFRWNLFWAYTGPGWLMSVAYLDPGNIESDLQAGSYSGFQLLWVLALSTLLGFFLQVLSARLGVSTGKHLAENCRDHYNRFDTGVLYTMMQLAIIGSDIQEIVGSAIAFRVLFGFPLWLGCLVTGLDTLTFLGLHIVGVRKLEAFFVLLILAMCICFFATFFSDPANPSEILQGFVVPYVHEQAAVQAVSILGAVVMPHNIYLHSALVLSRDIDRTRPYKVAEANKYFGIEAGVALFVSLMINAAVVAVFAHGFYSPTCQDLSEPQTLYPSLVTVHPPFACVPKDSPGVQRSSVACITDGGVSGTCMPIGLQGAAHALRSFLGTAGATLWALGLLAAGQSSTMTGTYAGQFVMEGFLQLEIPNWVRVGLTRAISLIPATMVALLANADTLAADRLDEALNVLQSLQLPFALLPLLYFTSSEEYMGEFANSRTVRGLGWASTVLVLVINAYLVSQSVSLSSMSFLQGTLCFLLGVFYTSIVARLARDAWNVQTKPEKSAAQIDPDQVPLVAKAP